MEFFTSDTHFGHERIITLCDRPFDSVEEMNEVIIENWNSVVRPSDTVWHLGDVALGSIANSLPLVSRLNGRKVLVPGNHDRIFSGQKQRHRERFFPEYRKHFQAVFQEIEVIPREEFRFVVSHFPYQGDSHDEDRYSDKRPVDEGLPLICGHVHEKWRQRGRMFNVGVDVNSFYPVLLEKILDWASAL